ncbi:MAG: monomeric [FeFe] hydrogenase [Alistipes sp.]|jgi:[FeFe] hydrogenase (group B1/B3)|nr:monomeric [FeFe] hydrogenase [Alistipes sp.]
MLYDNYAMLTKRELLMRMAKILTKDRLVEEIKYIPVEMRPRDKRSVGCCLHKDRYVLKHKIITILGFDAKDEAEDIDLIPLEEYARRSLDNKNVKETILSVAHEACSACIQSQYFVTNMCRGCEGRPCMMNCPKGAVSFKNGKALISQEDCVGCGLCQKVCPYHAIIYTPVPCEESCPVKAISKNPDGTENIDKDKCIYCGKCMLACPYGAIMERSKIVDIHKMAARPGVEIVAIVAPAIFGQFDATPGQVITAMKRIGFDDVVEVALGAEDTSCREAAELKERIAEGQPFMTSSCCPAYTEWVEKHAPELKPYVSETRSPMVYAARRVKQSHPGAEVVFVGPCLAKRHESDSVPEVDYVMSFEEVGAFMAAYGIDPKECEESPLDPAVSKFSRGYPQAGGVKAAVLNGVGEGYTAVNIDGLDKKNIGVLKSMVRAAKAGAGAAAGGVAGAGPGGVAAQFVEVMACEGGCVNGPCSLAPLTLAKKYLKKGLAAIPEDDK